MGRERIRRVPRYGGQCRNILSGPVMVASQRPRGAVPAVNTRVNLRTGSRFGMTLGRWPPSGCRKMMGVRHFALVTGVGHRRGIGHAVCERIAQRGDGVFVTRYGAFDAARPWSGG